MERVDRFYRWLADGPTPACDQILAAGLEHAETPYSQRIVEHLLRRGNDAAWAGLVSSYSRLSPEIRERLWVEPQRLRAGLAGALTGPSATARQNALATLVEHPCPAVAYLLPDALRDTSDEVRRTAAKALRRLGEVLADEFPAADWDQAPRQELASARGELAKALGEALRTFDLHCRIEVVEVSLWFTRELGQDLWRLLGNLRSQCGRVASTRLSAWNSPRLARFLLEGLAHPAWRVTVQQTLHRWSSREEVTAILRNSDVLDSAEVRWRLAGMKEPRWFTGLEDTLSGLPADARVQAPRWICHLGLSTEDKLAALSRWLGSGDTDVRRACTYALATLATPDATAYLAQVADGGSSLSTFARWCVLGKRGGARDSAPPREAQGTPPPGADQTSVADTPPMIDDEPADQWPACRAQVLVDDSALIGLVRDNMDICRPQLSEFMCSDDPGERLLGLRVIDGAHCAGFFAQELEELRSDPVDVIRRLACTILEASATAPRHYSATSGPIAETTSRSPEGTPAPPPNEPAKPNVTAIRRELREALRRLLAEERDPQTTTELVQRVRSLLRRLPGTSPQTGEHKTIGTEVRE